MKKSIIIFAFILSMFNSCTLLPFLSPEERAKGQMLLAELEKVKKQIKEIENSQRVKDLQKRGEEISSKIQALLQSSGLKDEKRQITDAISNIYRENERSQIKDALRIKQLEQEYSAALIKLEEVDKKIMQLMDQQPERMQFLNDARLIEEQLSKLHDKKISLEKKLEYFLNELYKKYSAQPSLKNYFELSKELKKAHTAFPNETQDLWDRKQKWADQLKEQRATLLDQIFNK